jgi:hypothetical protein
MLVNVPRLLLLVSGASLLSVDAFVPAARAFSGTKLRDQASDLQVQTDKPTGSSFLPKETLERAAVGSPIEKLKLAKDGSAAYVDVYEYARKIREGEMTWEDLDKTDLESVRNDRLAAC